MEDFIELLFIVGLIFLAGWLVMLLWNFVMPVIVVGIVTLNYWQALCLYILCRLLFPTKRVICEKVSE